tara:strand:+ start:622 stop:822 length:201 start_codon:yes stop_codon:yes gene_type:complete
MAWHIKKTSKVSNETVYYKGGSAWTATYGDRKTYTSQANAKAGTPFSFAKKTNGNVWDTLAVNESS